MQKFGNPIKEEQFLGFNDHLPPQFVPPGQFVNLLNVRVSDGKISKASGSSNIAPQIVNQPFTGLAELENVAAGSKYIVASLNGASNASWYSWAGSGSFASIAGANTLTNNASFFFETAVNVLYGFNGKEVGSWDGTTFAKNPGSIPKAYFPAWFHNYLFAAKTDSFPNRVYWSALGDPTNFAGAVLTISVNAGGVGYVVGDTLTITSLTGDVAKVSVTTVSAGAVTAVSLLAGGSGYKVATGSATTGGQGSGATINVLSVDTTTAVNFVDINPGDGDEIMGLGVLNDELFVFKRNTIWSITGFSGTTFTVKTVSTQNTNNRIYGYGCIAPGSIVATGNDLYFLSFVGDTPHIRSLVKTQYATTVEGGVITGDVVGTMSTLNMSSIGTSQGIYDGRYIKWGLATGGSLLPDLIIELDTYGIARIKGKTIHPFVKRGGVHPQFFILSTISGKANVYFADWLNTSPYVQGVVYKFDSTINTDLLVQNQIPFQVVTRAYMPDPARKHKWKYLYLKYDTGQISTLSVSASVDQGDSTQMRLIDLNTGGGNRLDSFVLDTSTLGSAGGSLASARVNLSGMIGKMAQFNFFESSNAPLSIYDFEIYSVPKPLRWN
jgi:hypothetical protein